MLFGRLLEVSLASVQRFSSAQIIIALLKIIKGVLLQVIIAALLKVIRDAPLQMIIIAVLEMTRGYPLLVIRCSFVGE